MDDIFNSVGQSASRSRCLFAIASSIGCFFVIIVIGGVTSPHSSLFWRYLGVAGFAIASAVLVAIVPGINTFKKPTTKLIGITVFTVLCIVCIGWYVPPGHGFIDELKSHDSVHRVVFILIVCVIAPVIEEIYFRGLLFPITSLHLGTRVGALLSAVLFILGHLSLGILFAAAIYTLLVYRYRSIFPSVFAHIAYNTVMVIHVIV